MTDAGGARSLISHETFAEGHPTESERLRSNRANALLSMPIRFTALR